MTDTLITNTTLLPRAGADLLEHRYVTVRGTAISQIGPMAACPESSGWQVIDGTGRLLMPGLVNGHNHAAMTLFRGYADDLSLQDWLHHYIFPAEAAHVNPDMVYWCTTLAAAEMIRSGTTCVADGYFFSSHAARAFADAGMRAVVAHGIVDFPAPSVPDPADNIDTVARFIEQWQNVSPHITPGVFAHAPYTCSPKTLVQAKELAERCGVRFFIHIAESSGELQQIIEPQGDSPIKHLDGLQLLDKSTTCVHAVWLDEADLDIVAGSGAAVITCPQSNSKLASGIAPVQSMLDRGIPVGIGTDGCASNNSLDLFREMDLLAKINKFKTGKATAVAAAEVLGCATETGAAAIGLGHLGRIEPGAPADMILLDLARPHLTPLYNQDLLVYAASGNDVDSVIIDGTLVMHNKQILSIDVAEAMARVNSLATRLH